MNLEIVVGALELSTRARDGRAMTTTLSNSSSRPR